MTQGKSKKEEFEDIEQEIYDAVDEGFNKATREVADILKKYIGSPDSKDKENDSGEEHEHITIVKRKPTKRNR